MFVVLFEFNSSVVTTVPWGNCWRKKNNFISQFVLKHRIQKKSLGRKYRKPLSFVLLRAISGQQSSFNVVFMSGKYPECDN